MVNRERERESLLSINIPDAWNGASIICLSIYLSITFVFPAPMIPGVEDTQ